MSRLIIIFFLFSTNFCFGQKIEGKYFLKTVSDGGGRSLEFSHGVFFDIYSGHLNSQVIGKGTYKIVDKLLSITYLEQPDNDASTYVINEQASSSNKGNVTIKLFDEQNNGTPGWIDLLNKQGQILSKIVNGGKEVSNFIISEKEVNTIRVSFLGYSSVSIPTKKLMGKNSTIKVNLLPVTKTYIKPALVTYQIKKITEESILLYSEKEGDMLFIK